jgi:hypothetical protein
VVAAPVAPVRLEQAHPSYPASKGVRSFIENSQHEGWDMSWHLISCERKGLRKQIYTGLHLGEEIWTKMA